MTTKTRKKKKTPKTQRRIEPTSRLLKRKGADARTVGERLQDLRTHHGLTVDEFAAQCGAPATTAREWLNSRILPRAEYLFGIADGFGLTMDWILRGPPLTNHESQSWPREALESEIAAHVGRAIAIAAGCAVNEVVVDGKRVLTDATSTRVSQFIQDAEQLERTWPLSRESAHVKNLIEGLASRAVPADVSDKLSRRAGREPYAFISHAARTGVARVERLRATIEASAWTGPARLTGLALARLVSGPDNRANPTHQERSVGNFAFPEGDPEAELHRQRVQDSIEDDDEDRPAVTVGAGTLHSNQPGAMTSGALSPRLLGKPRGSPPARRSRPA
jgi:transcriptional regulator with XRE-family HTH domain